MTEFKRVGLLGRREHPGVAHVVAELLDLLDSRGIDVSSRTVSRPWLTLKRERCNLAMQLVQMSIWPS